MKTPRVFPNINYICGECCDIMPSVVSLSRVRPLRRVVYCTNTFCSQFDVNVEIAPIECTVYASRESGDAAAETANPFTNPANNKDE